MPGKTRKRESIRQRGRRYLTTEKFSVYIYPLPEMKQSCVDCHGNGYGVENALEKAPDAAVKNRAEIEETIAKARSDLNMLEKSGPVHNMVYALDTIDAAQRNLTEAADSLPGEVKPRMLSYHPMSTTSGEMRSCIKSCHVGLRGNTTVTFAGAEFPHERHLGKKDIECKICHSNEPAHGKLTVERSDCSSCHQSQKERTNE